VALQTFTAGQVLTAAQVTALQTNDFNQTVSTKTANYTFVVGDRGTRVVGNGTSITFTVDNSIFSAGDTIKLHNINSTVLTIAAGAGVTINNAAGLTMVQWQEATLFATSASSFILFESTASSANGLTLLSTTSFSGVTSQSINDVFSATYDNYRIVANILGAGAGGGGFQNFLRLRVSGTDNTASNYRYAGYGLGDNSAALFRVQSGLTTSFLLEAASSQSYGYKVIDVFSPFKTENTSINYQGMYVENTPTFFNYNMGGVMSVTTSYTGFTLFTTSGGTTIEGRIRVYGYNN
jgi:hypothetical protein